MNRHRHEDLPIVLAGSAGGRIETGRLIQPKGKEVPMGNLFSFDAGSDGIFSGFHWR